LSADALLSGGLGATPLALLTDDAAPRMQDVVDRFADRVTRDTPNEAEASLLLSCGFILTGLRYDKAVARTLFRGVQKMKESSTDQAILEEGRDERLARGLVLARREDLLALLKERFQAVPPEAEAKVRATTDAAKLQAAIRRVIHIQAPDELPL
jgi:hypothetical protein